MLRKILVSAVILLMAAGLWAQRATCTVSRTHFSMQEQIQIIFTFEDIKNSPRSIDLKLHDDFSIVGGPYSSTNYSWVNGKSTSTNTVSYDLIAKKTGKILIPAYEFKIKNNVYKTEPIAVMVSKSPTADNTADVSDLPSLFMQTECAKTNVYQGETFTVNYFLYTAEAVVNYTTNPMSTMDGFIVDRFDLSNTPTSSKKIINGKEYLIAGIASLTLTPTSSGEFVIPAKAFRISVKRSGQSRTIFDDPFFGTNTKDVNLVAPADTIRVLPLPASAGTAFTGAIGEYFIKASVDSTLIQENQATALRVELSGHGNMEHFTFPEQKFPDVFEVFEPKVENDYKLRQTDYSGKRTWEYVLIPSKPGTYRFQDIVFTYFSPDQGKYITLRKPIPELRVTSHNELEGDYGTSLTKDEVRVLSKDIRFVQMQEGRVVDTNHNPLRHPGTWLFFYLSAALLLLLVGREAVWHFQQKNQTLIRYKNALKNALTGFNKMDETEDPAVYLGIVESTFKNYLRDKQLSDKAHKDIPDVLKTIETYKYAPGMLSHVQLNKLRDQALNLIEDIEKNES